MSIRRVAIGVYVTVCSIESGKEVIHAEIVEDLEVTLKFVPNYLRFLLIVYLELFGIYLILLKLVGFRKMIKNYGGHQLRKGTVSFVIYQLTLFSVLNNSLNE